MLRPDGLAGVALILREPRAAPSEVWLRDSFGLTPAEAALPASLAGGVALAEHGSRRCIVLPTLRSHLSRLLEKPG